MSFFEALGLNIIFLLFPIFVILVINAYYNNIENHEKSILFDISIFTSTYLIIRYSKYYASNECLMLLVNIPFIISIVKKKKFTSLIISLMIVYFYNRIYNLNLYIVLAEYMVYFVVFNYILKNKSFEVVLYTFSFFKIFMLSLEMYHISNGISFLATNRLMLMIVIFITISILSNFAITKGEETISLNVVLKKLEHEKEIKLSLFKLTHEVKNPLAVVSGYLSMMNYNDIEKVKKYNKIIKEEVDRTLDIMDNFSEYTKININKKMMNLKDLILDTEESLSSWYNEKNIKICFENLIDVFILGDYERLKQVLINMIKNSIEAIDKDGIICIKLIDKRKNIIMEVIDNGCGMSDEVLSHIHEVFYTTKTKGSGIGVALSNEIIELHGGNIKYDSKVGVGTKVIINIPKAKNV